MLELITGAVIYQDLRYRKLDKLTVFLYFAALVSTFIMRNQTSLAALSLLGYLVVKLGVKIDYVVTVLFLCGIIYLDKLEIAVIYTVLSLLTCIIYKNKLPFMLVLGICMLFV